jgi:hypothetical protein
MKLRPTKAGAVRLALLLAVSGVTASFVVGREPEPAKPAVAVASSKHTPAPAAASRADLAALDVGVLSRPAETDIQDRLFYIPPPPPPPVPARVARAQAPQVEAPPPKPTAPPLPFTFLGRLTDKGTTTVFVAYNGKNLNLREGDTAAELYRVERVTATEVVFRYEPLAERQVLTMGAVN